MPGGMPEIVSTYMPERISEYVPERMSEYIYIMYIYMYPVYTSRWYVRNHVRIIVRVEIA